MKRPAGGGELDLNTRTRNALLRSLRCLGKIGDIARAALVLVQFEHKMIT